MGQPLRAGRYVIEEKIAAGGQAEVFVARTNGPEGFAKRLALKRILPHLSRDIRFREMLLHEARLAAELDHPNLIQVFDLFEEAGTVNVVMELVDGPSLRGLLGAGQRAKELLPWPLLARIGADASAALAYAHTSRAIIHRDISPDNVLVSRAGAVKVCDFGL